MEELNMQELVPYLYVEKRFIGGFPTFDLHILIHAPKNKAVKRITEIPDSDSDFPVVDTSNNPFEPNIFIFKYKVVDKEEGFLDSALPNIYTDTLLLEDLNPSMRVGEKILRTDVEEVDATINGTTEPVKIHYPIQVMKDRVAVHIIDVDPDTNEEFLRSISIMTDMSEITISGPGEGSGGEGRGSGHPFI